MNPGDTVIIDLPSSALHGKAVEVLEDVPEFNLAPDGAEPFLAHMVRVRTPYGEFCYHLAHLSGTAEASERRRWEADLRKAEIEERQGELAIMRRYIHPLAVSRPMPFREHRSWAEVLLTERLQARVDAGSLRNGYRLKLRGLLARATFPTSPAPEPENVA